MNKPIVMLGSGGHASVLVDILLQLGCSIVGVVASSRPEQNATWSKLPYFPSDEAVFKFEKTKVVLVNGVGFLPGHHIRRDLHERFTNAGYDFMTVVSPLAKVSRFAKLASGVQVMPGAIINANTSIGKNTIVNTGAIIEHDCNIGKNNHVAPGVTISGGVTLGEFVHVGVGATIIQSVQIGNNVMIGAGSTVVHDLLDDARHYVARPYLC